MDELPRQRFSRRADRRLLPLQPCALVATWRPTHDSLRDSGRRVLEPYPHLPELEPEHLFPAVAFLVILDRSGALS